MIEIICKNYKKYKIFIKYLFSAGISFAIDIVLFSIFSFLLKEYFETYFVVLATIFARILSSFVNYLLNGNVVFQSNKKAIENKNLVKYYTLAALQMFASLLSVQCLYLLTNFNETLIKIPVDVIIFVINYFVQKKFIFVKKEIYEKK